MRNQLTIDLSLTLFGVVALAAIADPGNNAGNGEHGKPVAGPTEVTVFLNFLSADDTFSFNVQKAQKAGDLTVDTLDCCIEGDLWQVDLDGTQPSNKSATGVGDGSTSEFTGAAAVGPWVDGTVTISYAGGVDVFPAGVTVRFQYSTSSEGNTGMIVTPLF